MLNMIKGNGTKVIKLFIFKIHILHIHQGVEPDRNKALMKGTQNGFFSLQFALFSIRLPVVTD